MTLLDVSIVNVALPSIQQGTGAITERPAVDRVGLRLAFGLTLVGAGRVGDAIGRRTGLHRRRGALRRREPRLWARGEQCRARRRHGSCRAPPAASSTRRSRASSRRCSPAASAGGRSACSGRPSASRRRSGPSSAASSSARSGPMPDGAGSSSSTCRSPSSPSCSPDAGCRRPIGSPRRRLDLDPVGVVLLGAAVLALLLPLVETGRGSGTGDGSAAAAAPPPSRGGWPSSAQSSPASSSPGSARYTRRGGGPLVDLALFRVPGYSLRRRRSALIYFGGFTGIFFVLTIYFQQALGYTPLLAGLAVTPSPPGLPSRPRPAGYLVGRFGRLLVTIGLTTVLVGLVVVDLVLARVERAGPRLGTGRRRCSSPASAAGSSSHPTSPSPWPPSRCHAPAPREDCCRPASASAQPPASPSSGRSTSPSRPAATARVAPSGRCGWPPLSSPSPSWPARRPARPATTRQAAQAARRPDDEEVGEASVGVAEA